MNKNLILIFFIIINFTAINFVKSDWQDNKRCDPSALGDPTFTCASEEYCDILGETRIIDGKLLGQCRDKKH